MRELDSYIEHYPQPTKDIYLTIAFGDDLCDMIGDEMNSGYHLEDLMDEYGGEVKTYLFDSEEEKQAFIKGLRSKDKDLRATTDWMVIDPYFDDKDNVIKY